MTEVYEAVGALARGLGYAPAADAFSFDYEPRSAGDTFFIDPPRSRQRVGYLGGAGLDVVTVTCWLSTEAGHDPAASSTRLARDLDRLRRAVCDADLGEALLLPNVETAVSPRATGAVFAVGRLRVEVEVEVET